MAMLVLLRELTDNPIYRDNSRTWRPVSVLSDYTVDEIAIHAVFPPGRRLSTRVRAFVDFLVDHLGSWEA
jgi:DNA-binding transcriptional LysR family regulator